MSHLTPVFSYLHLGLHGFTPRRGFCRPKPDGGHCPPYSFHGSTPRRGLRFDYENEDENGLTLQRCGRFFK